MISNRVPQHDRCLAVMLTCADDGAVDHRISLGDYIVKERREIGLAEGARIVDAIDALPTAEQNRCHTPPYGLAFFMGNHMVWWVSVCWGCNNVFSGENLRYFKRFDGNSPAAVRLLTYYNKLFGVEIKVADA